MVKKSITVKFKFLKKKQLLRAYSIIFYLNTHLYTCKTTNSGVAGSFIYILSTVRDFGNLLTYLEDHC
jgi:hypothetical protein